MRRTLPTGMGTGTGTGMGTDTDTDTGMVRLITPGRRQRATTQHSTFPCRSVLMAVTCEAELRWRHRCHHSVVDQLTHCVVTVTSIGYRRRS